MERNTVTKSELIESIADRYEMLSSRDVELAIKTMIDSMAQVLATGVVLAAFLFTTAPHELGVIQKQVIPLSLWESMSLISSQGKNSGIGLIAAWVTNKWHGLISHAIFLCGKYGLIICSGCIEYFQRWL